MKTNQDLSYEVELLYCEGLTARAIAKELGCPIEVVNHLIDLMHNAVD